MDDRLAYVILIGFGLLGMHYSVDHKKRSWLFILSLILVVLAAFIVAIGGL